MSIKTKILEYFHQHRIAIELKEDTSHPSFELQTEQFLSALTGVKKDFPYLILVDISNFSNRFVSYLFLHMDSSERFSIKIPTPTKNEKIPGISHLWVNANWHERELLDLWEIDTDYSDALIASPSNKRELTQSTEPPKLLENGYAGNDFFLDGGKIVEAKLLLGFEYRGIEKICRECNYSKALLLLEHINTAQAPLFSQIWCSLLEKTYNIEITERVEALRMLVAEMIRIQDHLKTFTMTMRLLGGYGYNSPLLILAEEISQLTQLISTKREPFRFACPGGMMGDITTDWRNRCLRLFKLIQKELSAWSKIVLHSNTIKERLLRDPITGETALKWGFSGPVLRACGINYDMRKTNSYYLYDQIKFEIPLGLKGSAYDRFLVRLEEIKQSMNIIYQLIENFPVGKNYSSQIEYLITKESNLSSWASFFNGEKPIGREIYLAQEGPSGELGYHLKIGRDNLIDSLKIHTPSFQHAQAYEKLVQGFDIDDAIVIQSSLNFSIGELER